MTEEQKKALESRLWAIADILRGSMDGDEYRHYILGFIFLKYLSQNFEKNANDIIPVDENTLYNEYSILKDDKRLEKEEFIKMILGDNLGYFISSTNLYSIIENQSKLGKPIIPSILRLKSEINIAAKTSTHDDLEDLLEDLNLESTKLGRDELTREKTIRNIVNELACVDFGTETNDTLGDAYEYLIANFASTAGKKAGEFYTPQMVSKLLAKIVLGKNGNIENVYDPTCGSGSLLLRITKMHGDMTDKKHFKIFGNELNRSTYNLARMNMLIHGVKPENFDITQKNTLKNDGFLIDRNSTLDVNHQKVDAVVANPPFSANWDTDSGMETDPRFSMHSKLAPKTKADFAFINHMLYHLNDKGIAAVVVPHGVLFRGAAEGAIRREILSRKEKTLDAVIGLPANIFFGTSIPTCILVFKSCKDRDGIMFIDASKEFEKQKNQNILTDEHVNKIYDTYAQRKEIEKFSHIAKIDEIIENEYNLNIPRYVDTFEEEEKIDLNAVAVAIAKLDTEIVDIDKKIASFCTELGIKPPF